MDLTGMLEISGRTDKGRVRDHNEDSIGEEVELGTVVLADGMGGYHGGEVASAIAVNTILNRLHEELPEIEPGTIDKKTGYSKESLLARTAIDEANQTIAKASQTQPQYRGMGTTVVLGLFYDNKLTFAHVGDSRMYRIRDQKLEQLTVDHTLLQELVDRGFYTPQEAQQSLNKNLVTRALGIDQQVEIDVHETAAQTGDIYLLCSDGLNDMVIDEDILATVNTFADNLQDVADNLVTLANEKGGKDNVSVVLARPLKPFPAPPLRWHKRLIRKLFK
ncbi:MAG TPA: Stp1/IreP family PP2C-type Ser/Thr phosphatase [Gammaproteobacteria bacterium]|nr:Stp1/IreP family PP2C-type Ser/Thr phosphatase [Gammaproteobacteria bacterium]